MECDRESCEHYPAAESEAFEKILSVSGALAILRPCLRCAP